MAARFVPAAKRSVLYLCIVQQIIALFAERLAGCGISGKSRDVSGSGIGCGASPERTLLRRFPVYQGINREYCEFSAAVRAILVRKAANLLGFSLPYRKIEQGI